jgi:hypothetical protein
MKRFSRSKRGLALTSVALLLLFCALVLSPVTCLQVHAHPYTPQPTLGRSGNFAVLGRSTGSTVTCTIGVPCSVGSISITIIGRVLGTAGNFAVLGGSTVTNTGSTVLTGDLGVSPGTVMTGFPPGGVIGATHVADAVTLQAQDDVTAAYVNTAGQSCGVNLTGQDLGGQTLTPGVYCFTSSAQLTGHLTLDGQGNPASIFLFQIGNTLTTASSASVSLINGAQACNIFWQVGDSATMGTNTHFIGNILALNSITFTTGAVSNGGLYARNGAVTLDTNTISSSPCASGVLALPASAVTCTIGIPCSAGSMSITFIGG